MPPAARIGFWNDISSRLFGSIHVDSRSNAPFQGEIVRIPLRDCELLSVKSSPASLTRPSSTCCEERSGDMLALKFIYSGTCQMNIAGRETAMRPGDLLLMNSTASNFYSFDEPLHVIMLVLHGERLAHRMRQLRPYVNQHMRPDTGGLAILSNFFRSTWQDLQQGFRPQWSGPLSDTVWSLFDLAFPNEGEDAQAPARRLERRRAAQRLVEVELCNPEFRVHDIADNLHVTERYVQSLFNDLSTTPSRYLLERRLDVAAAKLRREPAARIGEIALSVGFNDLAYFSRAFRKRFGVSAREFRATSDFA